MVWSSLANTSYSLVGLLLLVLDGRGLKGVSRSLMKMEMSLPGWQG